MCWACKWALKKVKKIIGNNVTSEVTYWTSKVQRGGRSCWKEQQCDFFCPLCQVIKTKLMSICDQMGLLKSLCRKFVKGHLGVLIEELTTSDDVRTICVNTRACK